MTDPVEMSPGTTPYDSYVPGAKDPDGRTIKSVLGRHRRFVVYVTVDDAIGWNYDKLPERLRPAVSEFQLLNGLRSSLPAKYHAQSTIYIASALYGALLADEKSDPLSAFILARTFLETKARERARFNYVVLSTAFALLLFGLLLSIHYLIPETRPFWIAVVEGFAGGTVGAMTSIIQRGRDIGVDPLASASDLALQGMLRVLLGSIFGGFVVLASLASLAFGNLQGNSIAILTLTIVAGFSERLVPDLIEKIGAGTHENGTAHNPGVGADG